MAGKIERKYLAHFIDASFNGTPVNYIRLGNDLDEYNEELNPDVEVSQNILGEQNVQHNGYEVQSEVDPFYAYEGDPMFTRLCKTRSAAILPVSRFRLRFTMPATGRRVLST